jgi:hypothetical protein
LGNFHTHGSLVYPEKLMGHLYFSKTKPNPLLFSVRILEDV